jgi:hypothetical protein
LENIFKTRPFKIRNADEYDLANILNLFVSPLTGLTTPFDFENTIVKGRMGSGKTMYLRANQAYYLYGLVPSLLEHTNELILPVFIRLSDFQHLSDPQQIYRSIIVKIVEELVSIYLHLQDAKRLKELHSGISVLSDELLSAHKFASSMRQLAKLGSEEYIERVSNELCINSGVKPRFFDLSAQWKNSNLSEFKNKPNPGIKDIEECYKNLIQDQEGKILILIDEAGSLDKCFFQGKEGSAFFEILMNQFRTSSFIRTKIAVYPNSYSDMLTETRYGDVVKLEDTVNDERGYENFRTKISYLIKNYLNPESHEDKSIEPREIFLLNEASLYGDCLEQIIYASSGNMRRLIQLLDLSMNRAYAENNCATLIKTEHAIEAIKEHAEKTASLFSEQEKDFLESIISVCKSRGAYRFTFPNMSPVLYKYTSRSQEHNIVNVEQLGTGRKGTTYNFDYSYAVLKDIPTHHMHDAEKICRERSLVNGRWIARITQVNQELLEQATMPGKIEGIMDYVTKNETGFIKGDDSSQYFFQKDQIIEADKGKPIQVGKKVRFYPTNLGESKMANNIEIL